MRRVDACSKTQGDDDSSHSWVIRSGASLSVTTLTRPSHCSSSCLASASVSLWSKPGPSARKIILKSSPDSSQNRRAFSTLFELPPVRSSDWAPPLVESYRAKPTATTDVSSIRVMTKSQGYDPENCGKTEESSTSGPAPRGPWIRYVPLNSDTNQSKKDVVSWYPSCPRESYSARSAARAVISASPKLFLEEADGLEGVPE